MSVQVLNVCNMNEIVIIIVTVVFLLVVYNYYQSKRAKKKLRELNESRPELSRIKYINRLVLKGFDKHHAEVVYDTIKEFIRMDDISIYPEDDIHVIYGVEELQDMELIDRVCDKLNLRRANQKDCDELNEKLKVFNAEYILTLTRNLKEHSVRI